MAFPSVAEVEAFHTMGDIAAFIPLAGDQADDKTARGALFALLGVTDSTPPRVLGMETEVDFHAEVATCTIDPTGAKTKPNMAARGAMKLLGKISMYSANS